MASQVILSIPCEDHFTKFTLLVKGAQAHGLGSGALPLLQAFCALGTDCMLCPSTPLPQELFSRLPAPVPGMKSQERSLQAEERRRLARMVCVAVGVRGGAKCRPFPWGLKILLPRTGPEDSSWGA